MNYNYHAHTTWCSHATGTPEMYVERAIEGGILHFGFSDHFPFRFPDGTGLYWRVQLEDVEDYVEKINSLKNIYGDKIDIKVGFEMEYYPDYFDSMLKNALKWGAEYLILGQHFIKSEYERPESYFHSVSPHESIDELVTYADGVCAAIRSGVFSYVAHPDIFRFTGDADIYRLQMRKICEASRECGVPLEINLLGIRENRHYPNEAFWEIAGEVGSPVLFGFDAHDASAAFDGESIPVAEAIVKKYNLNYISEPKLVLLKEK